MENQIQGFLLSIGTRLCCMLPVVAPEKVQTLITPFFSDKRSPQIPFIIQSPVITAVFEGY